MISDLLDYLPQDRRSQIVESLEELANILDPQNAVFQSLLEDCRCGSIEKGSKK